MSERRGGFVNKWELLSVLREKAESASSGNDDNGNNSGYISGEDISKKFCVKRSSVWRSVNELKKFGYEIDSKINHGYKLISDPGHDIINDYELIRRLRAKNLNYDVVYKKSTDSTNSDAKKYAGENNAVIAAGEQTAGKGRYGRSFVSPDSKGVYLTIKINRGKTTLNIDDVTFYPLIAAAAVSRAVSALCGAELLIKWPNDLLYATETGLKKVCGILTEASIEARSRNVSYVIAGIGLNVNNGASDFPDEIAGSAASLKTLSGIHYNRADIIGEIVYYFTMFMNMPRERLLDEYRERLILGIEISFAENGRLFRGIARSINENGNLVAELENGRETVILSGEINFIQQRELRQLR